MRRATNSQADPNTPIPSPSLDTQVQVLRKVARHHQRETSDALTTILVAVRSLKSSNDPVWLRDNLDRIETAIGDLIDAVFSLAE